MANKSTNTAAKQTQTKAAAAETTAAKTCIEDEMKVLVAQAVQNAMAQYSAVPAASKTDEYVSIVFIGSVASGTKITLPGLCTFNRAGVAISVPKQQFAASLGVPVVESLLHERKLIVLSGLTADERRRFDLDYPLDEVLSCEAFSKLLTYDTDTICALFEQMCPEHKELIAKMYYSAYFEHNGGGITLEKAKALNDISKKAKPAGMFTEILDDIGRKLAQ